MFKSSSLKNIGKSIIEPSLNYKKYFNEAKLLYEQEERKNFKKNNSSSNIFTSRNSNSSSYAQKKYIHRSATSLRLYCIHADCTRDHPTRRHR